MMYNRWNVGILRTMQIMLALALCLFASMVFDRGAFAQDPEITVRFANPVFDCVASTYCVDVEFQLDPADELNRELFGMNVRFFYDSSVFDTVLAFGDFQGGYGVAGTPVGTVLAPATGTWFGFSGPATYVNAYVQLYNLGAPPIYISNTGWTKLFTLCFNVIDPTVLGVSSFCPSLVWDLEADPTNGGFNPTSQGVVMSVVLVRGSTTSPVEERVAQYNWVYDGPGTAPYGYPVATDCLDTYCPDIAMTKTATEINSGVPVPFGYTFPGDVITYSIEVVSTGNVGLKDIVVSDPDATTGPTYVSGDSDSNGILDLTETWMYSATRLISLTDVIAGSFTNVAMASGEDPDGGIVSAFDDETVLLIPEPAILITKTATQPTYSAAGEIITYAITVENPGNVALGAITVADPQATTGPTYAAGDLNLNNLLDVDEVWLYEATYQVTQADVDGGSFTNMATVSGTDADETTVSDDDEETVLAIQNAIIEVTKTATPLTYTYVGEIITYSITVENTGNVSIRNVLVEDPQVTTGPTYVSGDSDMDNVLDVGEMWVYTATYEITQADVDAGSFTNVATGTGVDPLDNPVFDDDDAIVTWGTPCVALELYVFLEGATIVPDGSATYTLPMRTDRNDFLMLPGQTYWDPWTGTIRYSVPGQPYTVAPWFYAGNEGNYYDTLGVPGDAGYPPTVVDWVLVSLRDTADGASGPICQGAALLHSDGQVELVDEVFECCDLDMDASYYVVVEHRNHMIIMSHEPIAIVGGMITYDFRFQQSYAEDPWGIGVVGQKEIIPGVFAMHGGNGEQSQGANDDTDTNDNDRIYWETYVGLFGEYHSADYNMNGDINANDRKTWEENNGKFTAVLRD